MKTLKKTVCLLVTCCVEQTRFEVLKVVLQTLRNEMDNKGIDIIPDLWVFDNGSTPETIELLQQYVSPDRIFRADKNYGFWSAINFFLQFIKIHEWEKKPEYLHVIESDHTYFALERLLDSEAALDKYSHIGSMRCQEFEVSNAHLYDKDNQSADSRRYAWVRQIDWDGTKIKFKLTDPKLRLYESNLVPLLHSVNRIDGMQHAFEKLVHQVNLTEIDFQRYYREKYYVSGLIDGGLFHAKLTWGDAAKLTGSWTSPENCLAVGYRNTRQDSIIPCNQMKVLRS